MTTSRTRDPGGPGRGRRSPSPDATMAIGVVLVVVSVAAFAAGLVFAKAPLVFASIACAALAKLVLEIGRRLPPADDDPGDLGQRLPEAQGPAVRSYRPDDHRSAPSSSLASVGMASPPGGRDSRLQPAPSAADRGSFPGGWRFDEVLDDDDATKGLPGNAFGPGPASGREEGDRLPGQSAPFTVSAGEGSSRASTSGAAGTPTDHLDRTLDRFGEHLVESLNQLFSEYVGEVLTDLQREVAAERHDVSELRNQLKGVVKAGVRREEAMQEQLNLSRDAIDDLRGELEDVRFQVEALAATSGSGGDVHDEVLRLVEEVRALRKRVALGGRRSGGGGLEPQQVQALADAVAAAILESVAVEHR